MCLSWDDSDVQMNLVNLFFSNSTDIVALFIVFVFNGFDATLLYIIFDWDADIFGVANL
jgi:hypothetical protein